MTVKEKEKILKSFIIIYLFVFLIFNWEDVSWLFNYKFISRALAGFFQQNDYSGLIREGARPEENQIKKEEINEKTINLEYSSKENSIEIPKIEISAPLVMGQNLDVAQLTEDLDRGVVYYPDSVLPGEQGQTLILGHSAPTGWPKIKYDWVFSNINELEKGDRIFIYFDHKKYNYSVTGKFFLEKGEEIPNELTSVFSMLILVSCWPPGKDFKRIAVQAELIK